MDLLPVNPARYEMTEILAREVSSVRDRNLWLYDLLQLLLEVPVARRTNRLAGLTAAIDQHPRRDAIRQTIHELWSHHSVVRVICEAGLPDEVSFFHELSARSFRRLMPTDETQGDLYVLLDSLRLTNADAKWIAGLPDEMAGWWQEILRPSDTAIVVACRVLALRATNLAMSRDLLALADDEDFAKSAFFHLAGEVERMGGDLHEESYKEWVTLRQACEGEVQAAHRKLEERGSSASIVFRLRFLRFLLNRIEQILRLRRGDSGGRAFATAVVSGLAGQRSILTVWNASTRQLARSIVEKTGRVGHHYIAQNMREWMRMGRGALLAGIITVGTALGKYAISSVFHAPMLVALLHSLNYSISFLMMQAGGFLLASKMPAVTATTLVDAMDDLGQNHMEQLRGITRTQTIVTLGNLTGAIPAAFLVDRVWHLVFGEPFLTAAEAEHGIHMLFPLGSGTIPFAIATGILLWLSSLATGWALNWLALHRIPQNIANSLSLRRRIGAERAQHLSHWAAHSAAGSWGYVVLGFLLGAVPVVFNLFGIPLEVRHVTLSAASLGLALDSAWLRGELQWSAVAWSLSGVAVVGVLNIATSFAASFFVAMRARDLGEVQVRQFLRQVGKELWARPMAFFLTPGDE